MKLTTTPVGLGKTSAPNSGSGSMELNKSASHLDKRLKEKEAPILPVPEKAKRSEPPKKVEIPAYEEIKRRSVADFVSAHLKK